METRILGTSEKDIEIAAEIIRRGGLVAMPTETVYGLAANALDPAAVGKIYQAKNRPADNPLIVHISELSELSGLVDEIPQEALLLAEKFWPGPLTMIFKKSAAVPDIVSGGLDTVSVRMPSNTTARNLIKACGRPLAAPSANLSGKPSPTRFEHIRDDLSGRVDAMIDGGDCFVGVESTVLSLVTVPARILRPGAVTAEQIAGVIGETEIDGAVFNALDASERPSSPGMKYKHYAPRASLSGIEASPEDYINYVNLAGDGFALCYDEDSEKLSVPAIEFGRRYDSASQARRLFSALRELDERDAKRAYAIMPPKRGVGLAVYNRLIRACGFDIIRPEEISVIGLTGQSGSGKTYVSKILETYGCRLIECDKLTRDASVYDSACVSELQAAFGEEIATAGELDRKLLAQRAFESREKTRILNEITFPRIRARIKELIAKYRKNGEKPIILDAPTLFEAGADKMCLQIIAVISPEELRIKRIMSRDGITSEEARLRAAAQHDEAYFAARADFVIANEGGDIEKLLRPALKEIGLIK